MIKQRTNHDCMCACLAMLFNMTYEESAEYFPKKALDWYGYHWEWLYPLLRHDGKDVITHTKGKRSVYDPDFSKPAIITVPSLNIKDGLHVIYWDGEKIKDPSTRKTYKTFPTEEQISSVTQKAVY